MPRKLGFRKPTQAERVAAARAAAYDRGDSHRWCKAYDNMTARRQAARASRRVSAERRAEQKLVRMWLEHFNRDPSSDKE